MYVYLQTSSTPSYPVCKYEIQFSKHRGKDTFIFNVLLEFPFHSVFSVSKYLELEAFIIKPQLTLLPLSATPLRWRQTEPLITGLCIPSLKRFPLASISVSLNSLLCSSTYRNSLLFSRPISRSHGTKVAFVF